MQTTESLKRRMKSAGDLLSVVKTMKALAAVSMGFRLLMTAAGLKV